jgi:hypothetical protein
MKTTRTALFFEDLQTPFGDNALCPITLELMAPSQRLLKVDGSAQPYAFDAFMRWFDQNATDPCTRQPLTLRMLHPVMTPTTHLDDYLRVVRGLAERGWDLEAEVDRDAQQRRPVYKRDRQGNERNHPTTVMRQVLHQNPWWRFTHTPDARTARRELDQQFVRWPNAASLIECATRFLECRARMWRFPPSTTRPAPIYLDLDVLVEDFLAVYQPNRNVVHEAAVVRASLVNVAQQLDRYTLAHGRLTMRQGALVLHAPSAAEWILKVAVPIEREAQYAWWRTPHVLDVVLRRLLTLQEEEERCPVNLHFTEAELRDAMYGCMSHPMYWFYRRPASLEFILRGDADWWLRDEVWPQMQNEPNPYKTSEEHARELRRDYGERFDLNALIAAIERICDTQALYAEGFSFSHAQIQDVEANPALLPSDPYTNPRLLPALEYGLGHMDAI